MFKDTPNGQTYYCIHENNNPSGICDKCLPKVVKQWDKEIEENYDRARDNNDLSNI